MAGAAETLSLQERLIRYLKTGTEGTFFLPGKNKVFRRFGNVLDVMTEAGQGKEAVELIKRVSKEKSYFKREPLIYFLAVATHSTNMEVKHTAYGIVNDVCENPVDLFTYLKHVKILAQLTKGWGRGLRRVVCEWYNTRDPMQVAEFVTQYSHVEKWSHNDVFRLSHIKPANEGIGFIVKVVTKGLKAAKEANPEPSDQIKSLIEYFDTVDFVKHSKDMHAVSLRIEEHNLHVEHIPSTSLASKEVWNSLLLKMSLQQVLSHLVALARRGFLTIPAKGAPVDQASAQIQEKVLEKIHDNKAIEQEKISPFLIYIAIRNYVRAFSDGKKSERSRDATTQTKRGPLDIAQTQKDQPKKKRKKKKKGAQSEPEQAEDHAGDGVQNDTEVTMTEKAKKNNPALYEALHSAFRVAVEKNLPTVGKRFLMAVKATAGEIGHGIRGSPSVSPLEVLALMATFLKKKEKSPHLGSLTTTFSEMKYPSEVQDLIQEIGQIASTGPSHPCDHAAPITWALDNKKSFDVFLIMTDGGELHGDVSVAARLIEYRTKMNLPDTKVVICGLTAPRLDFAKARGMLDIGGFDVTVPTIINEFLIGKLDQ